MFLPYWCRTYEKYGERKMKNYKLSDETKTLPCGTVLHRVVATTSFTIAHGVVVDVGDVGGWIEKESNLSDNAWVTGDAMVYGDAKVSDNAWITGKAHVFGNAQVYGTAQVYGDADVYGEAEVYDNARVSCNAWVYDNARVFGNAKVSGDAHIFDNAQIDGDTKVSGNAQVSGNAWVSGDAWVSDNAKVYGDTLVCDNAWISGDAKVMNEGDYIVFEDTWSSGRYFTWTKSNDNWADGSFYCTGDELIKKAYADSEDSGKHYDAYVKLVETLKNMEKEK